MNSDNQNIFFKYPDKRDVLFLFGAGTSYPDGVPLQRDILPMILSGELEEINSSEIGKAVVDFINANFAADEKLRFPKLEAVFGFIDYFLHTRESLSSFYSNSYIYTLKECLIKLIHYIINLKTENTSYTYQKFWNVVEKNNSNISVVTLNYDTLLEQAFHSLYKNNYYIDYCKHLMNFEKVEGLENYHFWINTREPLPVKNKSIPKALKIIKIHDSLNWKYCNCCGQVLLTPWDKNIDLHRNKFLGYTYPGGKEYEIVCPIDGNEFQTMIMPPTFVKNLTHPVISNIRQEASLELRKAKKIVIVGYSLSNSDIHIKAMLKKNISPDTEIIVVNPKMSKIFKAKFKSISNNVKFYETTFEEMLSNSEIINSIFE